ncbi:MAG: divalent-cation tolerance protein CutA [Candidatus Glassbacteria bacterium]
MAASIGRQARVKGYIVVLVTASSPQEGRRIARALVEERLCACVNVLDNISSTFWWEEQIQEEAEVLLLCKAVREKFSDIEKRVRELHSYTVPEVIALPITEGFDGYLNWISGETVE